MQLVHVSFAVAKIYVHMNTDGATDAVVEGENCRCAINLHKTPHKHKLQTDEIYLNRKYMYIYIYNSISPFSHTHIYVFIYVNIGILIHNIKVL